MAEEPTAAAPEAAPGITAGDDTPFGIEDLLGHLDWFLAGRMGLLLLALVLVIVLSGWLKIWAKKRWNAQIGMLVGRGVRYLGVILIALSILRELGFQIDLY